MYPLIRVAIAAVAMYLQIGMAFLFIGAVGSCCVRVQSSVCQIRLYDTQAPLLLLWMNLQGTRCYSTTTLLSLSILK